MESLGQHLDELPEVDTLVGDVVEDGFVAVALILHIAYFHLQSEVFGYLPALYHGVVLATFGLVVFVHVHRFGYAVDTLDVVGRLQVGLLHLQCDESAGERYHPDVMSRTGFHGYCVAFLQVEIVHVVVVSFPRVLELHLHEVGALGIAGHISQPVVSVQLLILPSAALATETSVATAVHGKFHIFKVHSRISPSLQKGGCALRALWGLLFI